MEYQTIYEEFINKCRAAERGLKASGAYFERHHIVPRVFGGGNGSTNIVMLTAREHYFAHCCLAKIYGGKMWSALFAMANMTKVDGSAAYFLRGRMIGVARDRAALVRSADMTRRWADGSFSRERVYRPISDQHRKILKEAMTGRRLTPQSIAKRSATKRANAKEFSFVHSVNGETFDGTPSEFVKKFGISQPLVSCLTRGKILSAKLWTLRDANVTAMFGRDPVVRIFKRGDGAEFIGTTFEFKKKYDLDSGVISNLVNGKNRVKSFKGWRYEGEAK